MLVTIILGLKLRHDKLMSSRFHFGNRTHSYVDTFIRHEPWGRSGAVSAPICTPASAVMPRQCRATEPGWKPGQRWAEVRFASVRLSCKQMLFHCLLLFHEDNRKDNMICRVRASEFPGEFWEECQRLPCSEECHQEAALINRSSHSAVVWVWHH